MPNTLGDLYAHPIFRQKLNEAIKQKLLDAPLASETGSVNPAEGALQEVRIFDENEDRLQGEVNFSARFSAATSGGRPVEGTLDFSIPWKWIDDPLDDVAEAARIEILDVES